MKHNRGTRRRREREAVVAGRPFVSKTARKRNKQRRARAERIRVAGRETARERIFARVREDEAKWKRRRKARGPKLRKVHPATGRTVGS